MNLSDKVVAATTAGSGAGAVAVACCTIGFWWVQTYQGVDLPDEVRGAVLVLVTLLCTAAAAGLAGWRQHEHHPAPSAVATVHAQDALQQGRTGGSATTEGD